MWVGVLKKRDKFRIGTGSVRIEFRIGTERSWFESNFRSARVSGRHDFSHGTRFTSGRILALDGFQFGFFCWGRLFSVSVEIFCFVLLFWKRTRLETRSDPDLLKKLKSFSFLKLESNKFPIFHLNLNNYLHSFEFNVDHSSWRASIHQYQKGKTRYAHYRQTDYLLAESGWHCSFCF
ncbi:putative glycosyl transferase, family 17 [Helianthus annuus]|nr:putative glycosyl transferase, family 17 [Helianthus annuus]